MSQQAEPAGAGGTRARYELTVVGRIGPVLQRALRSHGGGAPHPCVVVRAAGSADLVGLMQVLDAHGLEVRNVSRLPTTSPDA